MRSIYGFAPEAPLETKVTLQQETLASLSLYINQAAPTQSASSGILEQLEKLGSLREAGILTDEKFAAKKRTLLDRP